MDYRRSLHDTGNYQLTNEERIYRVHDAVWRCKSEEEKKELFQKFLVDSKCKQNSKLLKSKDGKFSVINKAKGVACKPGQRRRPVNERTRKR
jgi:hypothetical protein